MLFDETWSYSLISNIICCIVVKYLDESICNFEFSCLFFGNATHNYEITLIYTVFLSERWVDYRYDLFSYLCLSTYLQDLVIILETMRIIAIALCPIAPSLSLRIYSQLGFTEDQFRLLRWVCSTRYICSFPFQVFYGHPLKYIASSEIAYDKKIFTLNVLRRIQNGEA